MRKNPFIKNEDGITYVDFSVLKTRYDYNKAILRILDRMNKELPDWRFQQTLFNFNISNGTDLFYEESRKTLLNLLSSPIVQQYFVATNVNVVKLS